MGGLHRQLKPLSPFIIHRAPDTNRKKARETKEHWSQVTADYLTKEFARMREKAGVGAGEPDDVVPTLHQVRSLGGKLYERQHNGDISAAQRLYGHTTERMTRHYLEGHGVDWTDAIADLDR